MNILSTTNPLISVLTPSYNSGDYIAKAIKSVLEQTYTHWEHIVVDGNSKDETESVLNAYSHLKILIENDSGQSEAMNKAFKLASGELIIYLNADDYFYPDAFQLFVDAFNKNPEVDIVVGNLMVYKHNNYKLHTESSVSWKEISILKKWYPLNPISYMYKRYVQEIIGEFPMDEHLAMDFWFLLRAFYLFRPLKIQNAMGCFVFVENNKSSKIKGEYIVQRTQAVKFAKRYTPSRLPYVYLKLFFHKKNPNKLARLYYQLIKKLGKIQNKFQIVIT